MTSPAAPAPRTPTPIDAIADRHADAEVRFSPIVGTELGLPGRDDDLDDFSPAGWAAKAAIRRETLTELESATPVDAVDEVTVEAMRELIGLDVERHEAGLDLMSLNVIESPLQSMRDVLDLMPTDTPEQWDVVAARIARIPRALTQWHESLLEAASRGQVSARRQVLACIAQAKGFAGDDGYFADLTRTATAAGSPLPDAVAHRLGLAADAARQGYAAQATRLRDDLLDRAPDADAVGRERYALESRTFLGDTVDLEETYAWGQDELARISADIRSLSSRFAPSGSFSEAAAVLDADPAYRIEGVEALREWMQQAADAAITALDGTHLRVPEPVRRIECRIAPTHTGGIYYTAPSDDFSRPGRMWWSVPTSVTTFGTWRELTTVYHEGVPGHHLQLGQAVYRRDQLNRWRRLFAFTSGHAEGWALYAERLMADLGFMDDPGNRLGFLDAQSLRAARVVIDIGVHCEFPAPESVGGGSWTYEKAWEFLRRHTTMPEDVLRFELDRYLGWPGQAPSYKIGERIWMQLRDDVRAAQGSRFDPTDFHERALDLGGMGLGTLRRAVMAQVDA